MLYKFSCFWDGCVHIMVLFLVYTPHSKGLFQCFRETYSPYLQGDQIWFTAGAEVSGMKECVGYIARLNRIWPLQAAGDGTREDMACAKPMVLKSSMTGPYQGQKWEMRKWRDVRTNLIHTGVGITV